MADGTRPVFSDADVDFMRAALALAGRGLGRTWPGPAVGCVLVDQASSPAHIIARGWSRSFGQTHAEAEALGRAGERANGATAYVSLEPCARSGKSVSCAEGLVKAGVRRVVAAIEDPDTHCSGAGLRLLREAGIEVSVGCLRQEAEALNAGYFMRLMHGRPLVTLRLETSLDGRVLTDGGRLAGRLVAPRTELLRAQNDAVLTGSTAVIEDDPSLDCALSGMADLSPVRVVADSRLRLPLTSRIVKAAQQHPTWLLTLPDGDKARSDAVRRLGVELIEIEAQSEGIPDLELALGILAQRGITRLLVEKSSKIAAALLRLGLVDRIEWARAPVLLGSEARPAVEGVGLETAVPEELQRFSCVSSVRLGDDLLESYVVAA